MFTTLNMIHTVVNQKVVFMKHVESKHPIYMLHASCNHNH